MNQELKMMRRGAKKKGSKLFSFFIILLPLGALAYFSFGSAQSEKWNEDGQKTITVIENGLEFSFSHVAEKTVGEFLAAKKLSLREGDSVFPEEERNIFSGTRIVIVRAHEMIVTVDGGEQILHTQALSVGQALDESDITVDEDDIVKPGRETFAESGIRVTITRVQIEEQSVDTPVLFDKKVNEDSKLSWRKSVVTQKGEKGIDRLTYRVSKYDGKEVHRKLIKTERIKDPVTERVTQGTYVQVGKTHKGAASWYAFTGTLSAANPWLPIGSYVRVTNLENGKSVIVRINDRGPFVPGRIVDLDKVAFQKIASIGQGVINVTMEEITN
jgi:uncharacterized protein YabE (DUF348 family)